MLKLILHHTYRLGGQAVDLSRNENHGRATDVEYVEDGRASGSGALRFESGTSRLHVPRKPVWDRLGALRIDAWVKLAALGHAHTLVSGAGSFDFSIRADGVLQGTVMRPGDPATGAPALAILINSDTASPDGTTRIVPVGEWTRLQYLHDGFGALRLYVDGVLVAGGYSVTLPVRGLGSTGLSIGHAAHGDASTLEGRLDELKIWKHDPQSPDRQFWGRPTDEKTRDCWRRYVGYLNGLFSDPSVRKEFDSLMRCIAPVFVDLVRAVRAKGEAVIQEQEELARQYLALWTRGHLADAKMESWMDAWFEWLQRTLTPPVLGEYLDRVRDCLLAHPGIDPLEFAGKLTECDPQFAAYLRLMGEVLHARERSLGWRGEWLDRGERPGLHQGPLQHGGPDPRPGSSSPCGC